MHTIEVILLLLAVVTILAEVANKIKVPHPILLVLVGIIIGLIPWLPDFALSPEIIGDGAYTNRYLLEDEILPVVIEGDALARRPEWEKMRNRDWILFQSGSAIRKISDSIFQSIDKKFSPRIMMELSSVAGAVRCLEAGLGIGFISALSLKPGLAPIRPWRISVRR